MLSKLRSCLTDANDLHPAAGPEEANHGTG